MIFERSNKGMDSHHAIIREMSNEIVTLNLCINFQQHVQNISYLLRKVYDN